MEATRHRRLREQIHFASLRLCGAEDLGLRFDWCLAMVVTIALIGPAMAQSWIRILKDPGFDAPQDSPAYAVAGWSLIGLLLGTLLVAACQRYINTLVDRSRLGTAPGPTLAAGCVLPAFSLALSPLAHPAAAANPFARGCWDGWIYTYLSVLVYNLCRGLQAVIVRRTTGHRCRPLDRLLLTAAAITAEIQVTTRGRTAPKDCQISCIQLERLALLAERDLTLPGRVSRSVRRELRPDALRVAAVIRAHQVPLATAARPSDADLIVASLVAAMEALASGDRSALLVNAPAQVNVPSTLRRLFLRVWPVAVLIGTGLLLPLIPAIAAQPPIAGSLRWTLVVAGVLALVAGQDVAGQVNASLQRALPWR
ncbi:hypothetical protein [Streptacidiphilus cavernicola]|uniref:Integral membrane protein n=1 Tax=Streptacidiphilus cavernicola TaxID=3342716 RepID=A0ABV6W4I9_9ACTN